MNAGSAVTMAKTFDSAVLGVFQNTGWIDSGIPSTSIADNDKNGVTRMVTVPSALMIEAVQVKISATHQWLGDLGVELISPGGTRSVLVPARNSLNSGATFSSAVFLSNAFYGENSQGLWAIRVVDVEGELTGTLHAAQIRVFGH